MSDHLDPARPDVRLTEEGRRIREVVSYTRRGGRLSPGQQAAWDRYAVHLWLEDEALRDFSAERVFGRRAPLVVEIGSGVGESTVALAHAHPGWDVVALEVWRPGAAQTMGRAGDAGLTNVRVAGVDAVWALREAFEPASLAQVWTFFPDPWPKARHHKRRLIDADFGTLVADRLQPSGQWRIATDWADYAEQIASELGQVADLEGGVVPRWAERPETRFERRGLREGRAPTDLRFVRR